MREDDPTILAAFLEEVQPQIERLVTRALREGRSIGEIAIVLERAIDGTVTGGCAPRESIIQRWQADPTIPEAQKQDLATTIRETALNAVPVVLTVAREGYTALGIRRLEGDVVAPSKPN